MGLGAACCCCLGPGTWHPGRTPAGRRPESSCATPADPRCWRAMVQASPARRRLSSACAWDPQRRRLLAAGLLLLACTGNQSSSTAAAQQCASAACRAGACADANDGAPELGSLRSCAAVANASSCTLHMAALDPSLSPSVELGHVCARACGWCVTLTAFAVEIESLATPFCRTHRAAQCTGAAGSSCHSIDIFSLPHPMNASAACRAVAGCTYTIGSSEPSGCVLHPSSMSAEEMAWLANPLDPSDPVRVAIGQQKLAGSEIMGLSLSQLVQYGVPHGDAATYLGIRDSMFRQYIPGLRQYATTQGYRAPANSPNQKTPVGQAADLSVCAAILTGIYLRAPCSFHEKCRAGLGTPRYGGLGPLSQYTGTA